MLSRPRQARLNKRHIADPHPSNATLVPLEDDLRPVSIAPTSSLYSRNLNSPHIPDYPLVDVPYDVHQLGPPSALGYHTTSQLREKPISLPPPPKPQKKSTLGFKGVGKMLRRTFSRKHSSAPAPVKQLSPVSSRQPSFYSPGPLKVTTRPVRSASPSPTPTVQATEVMDIEYEDLGQPPPFTNPQSSVAPYEDYTAPYHHTPAALERRPTTPHPRRFGATPSVRSMSSSGRAPYIQQQQHYINPDVHAASSHLQIDQHPQHHPLPPTFHQRSATAPPASGSRLLIAPQPPAQPAPLQPQRKRVFTGPWWNRRGDMWIGVGPGPGEFRVVNAPDTTFHPNFSHYPSEYGHFMNADGDIMDAVSLRMVRRAAAVTMT